MEGHGVGTGGLGAEGSSGDGQFPGAGAGLVVIPRGAVGSGVLDGSLTGSPGPVAGDGFERPSLESTER